MDDPEHDRRQRIALTRRERERGGVVLDLRELDRLEMGRGSIVIYYAHVRPRRASEKTYGRVLLATEERGRSGLALRIRTEDLDRLGYALDTGARMARAHGDGGHA